MQSSIVVVVVVVVVFYNPDTSIYYYSECSTAGGGPSRPSPPSNSVGRKVFGLSSAAVRPPQIQSILWPKAKPDRPIALLAIPQKSPPAARPDWLLCCAPRNTKRRRPNDHPVLLPGCSRGAASLLTSLFCQPIRHSLGLFSLSLFLLSSDFSLSLVPPVCCLPLGTVADRRASPLRLHLLSGVVLASPRLEDSTQQEEKEERNKGGDTKGEKKKKTKQKRAKKTRREKYENILPPLLADRTPRLLAPLFPAGSPGCLVIYRGFGHLSAPSEICRSSPESSALFASLRVFPSSSSRRWCVLTFSPVSVFGTPFLFPHLSALLQLAARWRARVQSLLVWMLPRIHLPRALQLSWSP
ncbi:hypothetical protein VTN96DRAFT_6543 [Rasamsonia emersonii]